MYVEWSFLSNAVAESMDDLAKLLLDLGTVEAVYKDGQTTLNLACKHSGTEIACLLIDRGANINTRNNESRTRLYNAVFVGNYPLTKNLLSL